MLNSADGTIISIQGHTYMYTNMHVHTTPFSKYSFYLVTVKPVLTGHSKIDNKTILMIRGSLMKAESIAECSLSVCLDFLIGN